uniref:Uncharacterized protein n=1 Tax=Rhizophora mucronata TaxID=61149 RepID=A0A2P2J0N4_RHIMU
MKPIDVEKRPAVVRAASLDDERERRVEKREINMHNVDSIKQVEKKLVDKGVLRMDRHPMDGLRGGIRRSPRKSGHGGKYTWEGPDDNVENELEAVPPAIDEKDPNYVDEEAEERIGRGEESEVAGLVVGEVEVPKAAEAREGVARVEIDPVLNA